MRPAIQLEPTLVDLLDRVLDRGLVIQADIIICLAGVPLVGISLRAFLAGMETMVQYGMMGDWDGAIRGRGGPLVEAPEDARSVLALQVPEVTWQTSAGVGHG